VSYNIIFGVVVINNIIFKKYHDTRCDFLNSLVTLYIPF